MHNVCKKFLAINGHMEATDIIKNNRTLGKWVMNQLKYKENGNVKKLYLLNSIHFFCKDCTESQLHISSEKMKVNVRWMNQYSKMKKTLPLK